MAASEISAADPAAQSASHSARSEMASNDDWQNASREPISVGEIDRLIHSGRESTQTIPPLTIPPLTIPPLTIPPLTIPPLTTDEQFLRRVSLDLTGQLPTPEELDNFIADDRSDKRAQAIDRLLDSDGFARYWARYWRDIVTARLTMRRSMGLTRSFEEWLFEQFHANRNWGDITRDILTANGELRFKLNQPTAENGQLFFLVAHDGPEAEERAAETSRVFLGVQIQCAQCHDHPTENWTRKQFHELSAYFARIKYEQLFIEAKLSGVKLTILERQEHRMELLGRPEEYEEVQPRFLNGASPGTQLNDQERRSQLAALIVAPDNHWFAASYVSRVWDHLMGWSFYEHVDDLGDNKTVIYPETLTRLTGAFRGSNYDTKALFRAIANSAVYQRQLIRTDSAVDYAALAGVAPKRLRPDALWDSLVHVLGKIEHGYRFHTQGGVRFNKSFQQGRFQEEFDFDPSAPPDEALGTLPQALMIMNNQKLNARVKAAPGTMLGQLLKEMPDNDKALTRLYQKVLARSPTKDERNRCESYLTSTPDRAAAFEDILWALINSTEFQTNR